MQECTGFRDVEHNFRYHCMLAVSLSLPSFCECNLLLSYHSIVLISRCNVLFCIQEYSGRRVVKHNFRYRVHPCSMSIIYPLLCFLNVIYAPSCNRCVLITPVPGARSPCTSPSAWGSFPDSIEPRGMHQRGAPPFPPSPMSMQLSAGMGGACVPSADAPALVPLVPRLFLCQPMLFPAGSARPTRSLFRLPALAHARPPRTPTARTCFRQAILYPGHFFLKNTAFFSNLTTFFSNSL